MMWYMKKLYFSTAFTMKKVKLETVEAANRTNRPLTIGEKLVAEAKQLASAKKLGGSQVKTKNMIHFRNIFGKKIVERRGTGFWKHEIIVSPAGGDLSHDKCMQACKSCSELMEFGRIDVSASRLIAEGSLGFVYSAFVDKKSAVLKFVYGNPREEIEALRSRKQTGSLIVSLPATIYFNKASMPQSKKMMTALVMPSIEKLADSNRLLTAITLGEVRMYVKKLVLALSELHVEGICHNDVKERNTLCCFKSELFLLIDLSHASRLPKTVVGGTFGYQSPEQVLGCHSQLSTASDIFSVGIIILRCLLGGRVKFGSDFRDEKRAALEAYAALTGTNELSDIVEQCGCKKKCTVPPHGVYHKTGGACLVLGDLRDCVDVRALDLANQCLSFMPKSRPSATDILNHEFFSAQGVMNE